MRITIEIDGDNGAIRESVCLGLLNRGVKDYNGETHACRIVSSDD